MYRGATDSNIKIVTNGLMEYWDGSQLRSNPGSGNSWYDVGGRNKTGTLVNGAAFTSAYGGGVSFDGADDGVNLYTNNAETDDLYAVSGITFSVWALTNYYLGSKILLFAGNTSWANFGPWMSLGIGGGNIDLIWQIKNSGGTLGSAYYRNQFGIGQVFYATGTYDGTTLRVYHNGIFQSSSTLGGNIFRNTGVILTLGLAFADTSPWLGNIYSAKIYNRALTDAEILQNYNATKTRFGL